MGKPSNGEARALGPQHLCKQTVTDSKPRPTPRACHSSTSAAPPSSSSSHPWGSGVPGSGRAWSPGRKSQEQGQAGSLETLWPSLQPTNVWCSPWPSSSNGGSCLCHLQSLTVGPSSQGCLTWPDGRHGCMLALCIFSGPWERCPVQASRLLLRPPSAGARQGCSSSLQNVTFKIIAFAPDRLLLPAATFTQ